MWLKDAVCDDGRPTDTRLDGEGMRNVNPQADDVDFDEGEDGTDADEDEDGDDGAGE